MSNLLWIIICATEGYLIANYEPLKIEPYWISFVLRLLIVVAVVYIYNHFYVNKESMIPDLSSFDEWEYGYISKIIIYGLLFVGAHYWFIDFWGKHKETMGWEYCAIMYINTVVTVILLEIRSKQSSN